MNAPQQTETSQPTPEQLLQLLDLQLARERAKRPDRSRNRAMILAFGLLAIVAAGGIALVVAQRMLLDLHDRGAGARFAEPAATMSEK
jgi:hypothetical protein